MATKKLLLLTIASFSIASVSYASVENGKSPDTPATLSELGDLAVMDWVSLLRKVYDNDSPDRAFELLKKLDKISESLGDDSQQTNGREQKIAELIEANQSSNGPFCTRENLNALDALVSNHRDLFLYSTDPGDKLDDYHESVDRYFVKRTSDFASLCRSYVLENLNKSVGKLKDYFQSDMVWLGDKLVLAGGKLSTYKSEKLNAEWLDILLVFLEDRVGIKYHPQAYLAGKEGKSSFKDVCFFRIDEMCSDWVDATSEARYFAQYDYSQREHYTDEQARWINYSNVCDKILDNRKLLSESLFREFKTKSSLWRKTINKLTCSG